MLQNFVFASATSTAPGEASPASVLCGPSPAPLASQELSKCTERQLIGTARWVTGQDAAGGGGQGEGGWL